jgi:hypothetical protein
MNASDIVAVGGIFFIVAILISFGYIIRLQNIDEQACLDSCKPFISMSRGEECYCLDAEGSYNLSKPKPE